MPLLVCLSGPTRADDCPATLSNNVLIRESDTEPLRGMESDQKLTGKVKRRGITQLRIG